MRRKEFARFIVTLCLFCGFRPMRRVARPVTPGHYYRHVVEAHGMESNICKIVRTIKVNTGLPFCLGICIWG